MPFLVNLAWRDLRSSGRSLWIFCACLALGVSLISAAGGLYQSINSGLLADTRTLTGGDLEVSSKEPLAEAVLAWIDTTGTHSLVIETDTMLGTQEGQFLLVELQSVDSRYPLYGELQLSSDDTLAAVTAFADGHWGIAIDPVLATRLGIDIGDTVYIGALEMKVRALVLKQPDRNLNANWRGTPALLAAGALQASGLIQPGSRVDYDYRIATEIPVERWRSRFNKRFPDHGWRVRTFEDRSQRIAERLGQLASGLLIIAFSTLFIGGLGVFNSIQSYLQTKLKTIATLRALGLRNGRLARVYLLQVAMLAGGSSLLGCLLGAGLALIGAQVVAAQIPIPTSLSGLLVPGIVAIAFGLLTAFTFALPAIGRAIAVQPASLFRGMETANQTIPAASLSWWIATAIGAISIVTLVLIALPDPLFGLGFVLVVAVLILLLDLIVRGVRQLARRLSNRPDLNLSFALRLALANLYRPGAPLRSSLLSLGSALTLLVACTLIVTALLRAFNSTIPAEAPALVLYDIIDNQLADVAAVIAQSASVERIVTSPLVRSRITAINEGPLETHFEALQKNQLDAVNNEYKLSYSTNNIDSVRLVEGEWWSGEITGTPKMAMEDREFNRLGLKLGDTVDFMIGGSALNAEIVAIYAQKGMQTRFWFEGILSAGALDPFINRYVGTVYMDDTEAIDVQQRIARVAPNVISIRTASLLASAGEILGQATAGLAMVAGVSLGASLLVLISVMAAGRTRQIYEATILHSLGTRLRVIKQSLYMEYLLLALITSTFSILVGSAIALPLLQVRLKLPSQDLIWIAIIVAVGVSTLSLSLGARYLLRRLALKPATLLRDAN